MTRPAHPLLDGRTPAALLAVIRDRLRAYTPDWHPGDTGPGAAVLQVLARDLQVLAERLELAPAKNEMAFLDLLGLDTIAAQGARAPVVFQGRHGFPDGRVPAGTQVGAKLPGGADPIVFETEHAIALAIARLTDVVGLWPGRDAYVDHGPAIRAGAPVTLFEPLVPVPHELYLAHDIHLALAGQATVEVQFELGTPGSAESRLTWEYWDGDGWRGFKEPVPVDTRGESFDGTLGLTRSGVVRLVVDCAEAAPRTVHGVTSYWIRARATEALPPTEVRRAAQVARIRLQTSISNDGVVPDSAYANQSALDLTNVFQPFGPVPSTGSVWYLASKEVFSKPGATVRFSAEDVSIPAGQSTHPVSVSLEVSDGTSWRPCSTGLPGPVQFIQSGGKAGQPDTRLWTELPSATGPTTVNGTESYWARFRVVSGAFVTRTSVGGLDVDLFVPPMLSDLRIGYEYSLGTRQDATACVTYNDFEWADRSDQARGTGQPFEAFSAVTDRAPTLYLGFDAPLPADQLGLYLDLEPAPPGTRNPALRWEYWDGSAWSQVTVTDETADLAVPGMVNVLWPGTPPVPTAGVLRAGGTTVQLIGPAQVRPFRAGDRVYVAHDDAGELATVAAAAGLEVKLTAPLAGQYTPGTISIAALPRFGVPRTWLRARMDTDGEPVRPRLLGAYANAVWAVQARTITDELLGGSTGQPRQVFFFRERPVLRDEVVEVRELSGSRAAVELPLLRADLERNGMSEADLRLGYDRRTGTVNEVWVRWQARPNLFFSRPGDRHYLIERTRGRVLLGDGTLGRIPPPGTDNVLARRYRTGGGVAGNVPAGTITELISGVLAESVGNPRAADGGADPQPDDDVLRTGPETTRHRRQGVSRADYEALAREASPAVALARALPATHPSGRHAAGWVTVVVVPHSRDPRPQLGFELRRRVERFLALRVPVPAGGRVAVIGPAYLPVGIHAIVSPTDPEEAGPVHDAVVSALERYLHPLYGGVAGPGAGFGADLYVSAVAALIEGLSGVDHVRTLELLVDGSPVADVVPVPPDRLVAAGPLRISLVGQEG